MTGDEIDKFLLLLDLQRELGSWRYDKLGLANLDKLRNEVYMLIESERLKYKKDEKENKD